MNARLKPLLILAGSLCVCQLALVAYACILQLHGWYHGAPEEGIARVRRRPAGGCAYLCHAAGGGLPVCLGKMPPPARPL